MVDSAKENVTVTWRSKSQRIPIRPLNLSLSLSFSPACRVPSFSVFLVAWNSVKFPSLSFKRLYYMASKRIESFQAEHILHQSNPGGRKFISIPPIKFIRAAMYSKIPMRPHCFACLYLFLGATNSCWASSSGMDSLISEAQTRSSGGGLTSPVRGGS